MFKVTAFPTDIPNEFHLYVADIKVSRVTFEGTLQEVQEHYQLPKVWLRYYMHEETERVDLSIIYTISNLNNLSFG